MNPKDLLRLSMRVSALLTLFLCSAVVVSTQPSALRLNGKIAFTSDRDGNQEIYMMNPDGTNQTRLTNNSIVDDHAMWSPDGKKLAFVSQREAGGFAIFQMNMDGTNRIEITPLSNFVNVTPWGVVGFSMSWSPDGRKIAFQDPYYNDIWVVDVETRVRQNLTNDGGAQIALFDHHPAWSPDGTTILYASPRYNGFCTSLYAINPDGTNRRLLSGNHCPAFSPSWSPDGTKIVFVQLNGEFVESELRIANSDGTNVWIFDGGYPDPNNRDYPRWSPDGHKIAFNMTNSQDIEIYVKNIDGTGYAQLTNTPEGLNYRPSWQPLAAAACASPNPIDCPDFFIGQQYRDFLGREPEPSCPPDQCGLDFYMPILNGCGDNVECMLYTRGALSANFFRSPEFGSKGGYVANLFNIVIGQRATTVAELSDPSKVERPHYAEFMADLASLSSTDSVLTDQKKDQLAIVWLGRTEVQSILPNTLTNQQFVQKLETIAGVTLANESALIANLDGGVLSRAQVLRAIAESPEIISKFYIQNFVTMEYFGYLRRDPEDCHVSLDPSSCGYIFHNNRFNTPGANPDLIENIIVRGFIESPEYRQRFGP